MKSNSPTKVLVVQRRLAHYRVSFYEALRVELRRVGCELVLAYGESTPEEATKQDAAEIAWAEHLPTTYWFGARICWQPFSHLMRGASVVVLTPENKLVNNLPAQLLQRRCRVMLWGHGANLQGRADSWRERVKRRLARHADWWLAYTEMSRPLIGRSGFPADRITVLNNASDTVEMSALHKRVTPVSQAAARERTGLSGRNVGVFLGSLYADKRLDFLLQAALEIRQRVPDFELLVLGDGPLAPLVQAFCAAHAWARYAGMCKGQEKADALSLCKVMLNPGLVGLGVLDSFVAGVPMLTTDCGIHSPEISYLASGVNGWMTPDTPQDFIAAAVTLLTDDAALQTLRRGCAESALTYTVENMAKNFAAGVRQCLDSPSWR